MNTIEVKQIMQEVCAEIEEKQIQENAVDFKDCIKKEVGWVDTAENYQSEKCKTHLFSQTKMWKNTISHPPRKTGKKLIDFVLKYANAILRFLLNPWVNSQNEFNANVVETNHQLYAYIHQMETKIDTLEKKIQAMEEKGNTL